MASGLREVSLTRNHRSTEKLASMAASLRKILQSEDLTAPKKLAAMQRFLERSRACRQERSSARSGLRVCRRAR